HVPPSRENVPEVSRCSTVVSSPPGGTPAGFCSVLISVLLVREGLSWLRSAPWGVSVPECPDQVPVSGVLYQASHGGQLMGSAPRRSRPPSAALHRRSSSRRPPAHRPERSVR